MLRGRRKTKIALGVLAALVLVVVVVNWTWGRLPDEPEPTGELVQLGDARVHYVERPGSGTPVVMIHGLPGTAHDFDRVAERLDDRRTIAIDRPGFGYSSGEYHPFDEQLTAIERLLDEKGVRRAVLVGHSYGGTISLAFAARHPERVAGLVLVDAAAAGQRNETIDRMRARLAESLTWPVVEPIANATFSQAMRRATAEQGDEEAFAPDPVDDAHLQHLLESNMRPEDLDAYAGEVLEANDVMEDLDPRLATIDVPAVVIQGDGDKLVEPEHGRRLAATLPDARLVMLPTGHMAPYTHPDRVAAEIDRMAARADRAEARDARRDAARRR